LGNSWRHEANVNAPHQQSATPCGFAALNMEKRMALGGHCREGLAGNRQKMRWMI
jgi:hypothetical protein